MKHGRHFTTARVIHDLPYQNSKTKSTSVTFPSILSQRQPHPPHYHTRNRVHFNGEIQRNIVIIRHHEFVTTNSLENVNVNFNKWSRLKIKTSDFEGIHEDEQTKHSTHKMMKYSIIGLQIGFALLSLRFHSLTLFVLSLSLFLSFSS